jgi:hypothetical protein
MIEQSALPFNDADFSRFAILLFVSPEQNRRGVRERGSGETTDESQKNPAKEIRDYTYQGTSLEISVLSCTARPPFGVLVRCGHAKVAENLNSTRISAYFCFVENIS